MRHAVDLLQLRHVPSSILCRAENVVAADPYLITLFPIGEGQVGIEVGVDAFVIAVVQLVEPLQLPFPRHEEERERMVEIGQRGRGVGQALLVMVEVRLLLDGEEVDGMEGYLNAGRHTVEVAILDGLVVDHLVVADSIVRREGYGAQSPSDSFGTVSSSCRNPL